MKKTKNKRKRGRVGPFLKKKKCSIGNKQTCDDQLLIYETFIFHYYPTHLVTFIDGVKVQNSRTFLFQRLTIWANCPMNLQKFPLDSQICFLTFGSFGYSAEDIVYHWKKPSAVSIDEVGMAQFLLKDYQSSEKIEVSNRRTK